MGKTLVIVESPAKAKTIEKFLGKNKYEVLASLGHVRDLPKSQFGVDIENDFAIKYITIRGKGDIIKELKKAAAKADHVLLATDPDREGEAIAWHLQETLKLDPTDPCRIEFNEITKDAVKNAVKHPREISMLRVESQAGAGPHCRLSIESAALAQGEKRIERWACAVCNLTANLRA